MGNNVDNWEWGKVHTLEFVHPLGKQWPLNLIFNVGPFPIGGGRNQISNM
jgi:penicillin amidase